MFQPLKSIATRPNILRHSSGRGSKHSYSKNMNRLFRVKPRSNLGPFSRISSHFPGRFQARHGVMAHSSLTSMGFTQGGFCLLFSASMPASHSLPLRSFKYSFAKKKERTKKNGGWPNLIQGIFQKDSSPNVSPQKMELDKGGGFFKRKVVFQHHLVTFHGCEKRRNRARMGSQFLKCGCHI